MGHNWVLSVHLRLLHGTAARQQRRPCRAALVQRLQDGWQPCQDHGGPGDQDDNLLSQPSDYVDLGHG